MADDPPAPLPGFFERLALAFRVLFDAASAARVKGEPRALPAAAALTRDDGAARATEGALQLLALLQREGRLVDFLEEDITTFADADVGAAARVVHEGCRKALRAHGKLAPIRAEDEGARVTVTEGETQSGAVKLTGNVAGKPPFTGALRHRGIRATDLRVPSVSSGHDAQVIAPAEVEL